MGEGESLRFEEGHNDNFGKDDDRGYRYTNMIFNFFFLAIDKL